MSQIEELDRLASEAQQADELHERSRAMLVGAVRRGARAGLTQREIAQAVGRSQPEVSRLLRFHGTGPVGKRLSQKRTEVLALAKAAGVQNLRVFGSVSRGTDRADSDVDLLVDIPHTIGLFGIARLEQELGAVLGTEVDVVPAGSLRAHLRDDVLQEAVPL